MSKKSKRRDPSRLAGEDLSKGPTPQTRHPGGGLDDVEDTTQGPTRETRQTMRASKDDPAASGEPTSDPRTRGEIGGDQDAGATRPTDPAVERGEQVTRSEEELKVGTRQVGTGKARMTKTVESERVQETVPVEHEEAVISREPIAAGEASEADIGEQTVALDLTEEVVDVDKQVVPKERVRLDKETHTDEQTVEADLRKERVEVEHDEGLEERR
jgi:uncharacterized protein (TIGR02271 family)